MWFALAWQFGVPVRELQKRMGGDEFALWPVWLEMRREHREPPAQPANHRDPKQVYDEFKTALMGLSAVNHGG